MFSLYNLKRKLYTEKRSFLISLISFFIGFVFGALYCDFSKDSTFLKSMRATESYLKKESAYSYGFNEEISLLGIFFGGFFIFGKSIVLFFMFRSGFMLGYFVSFFIKAYSVKGMLVGLFYLFLSLLFCMPWQFFLSSYALDCCRYTNNILFRKKNCVVNLKSFFSFFVLLFLVCLIFAFFGNFLRTKLFSDFIEKIFV